MLTSRAAHSVSICQFYFHLRLNNFHLNNQSSPLVIHFFIVFLKGRSKIEMARITEFFTNLWQTLISHTVRQNLFTYCYRNCLFPTPLPAHVPSEYKMSVSFSYYCSSGFWKFKKGIIIMWCIITFWSTTDHIRDSGLTRLVPNSLGMQ